ncbi:MAG: TlpA family protein disulfide reductase [Pararhodobacter sp.]|nr:TlpA family protein disulfide reductase [Pararhodobacter sp.]
MSGITLGPLVLSMERFAFIAGAIGFVLMTNLIGRSRHADPVLDSWAMPTLLIGLIAARLSHVARNLESHVQDPFSVIAFWQGGFDALAGLGAVALVLAVLALRRRARLAQGLLAASLVGLLLWQGILQMTPAPDMPLPATRFAALDGAPATLAGTAGGPVVINLWATWCPPCRRELPMMMEIAGARPDVRVVFLNQGEPGPEVRQYLLREGLATDRVLLDPSRDAMAHFQTPGLPATLFFSSDGTLEDVHLGEISRAAFQSRLQSLR